MKTVDRSLSEAGKQVSWRCLDGTVTGKCMKEMSV